MESIRREKFWLGEKGHAKNPLIGDLQASVQHLSEGLYSKETHFVHELVQNAEDNSYAEGVTPWLSMELLDSDPLGAEGTDGALLVANNELGFTAADVRALCAVGASTKKHRKHSDAFIGDKGIGFKSVFVVSKRPAIYSNGFHFSFSEDPDPTTGLGYIVPTVEGIVPPCVQPHVDARRTVILLPLKAGKRAQVERELAGIAPETLLFLRKLSALRVRVGGGSVVEVARLPGPVANAVRLCTRAGDEERERLYWVAAHELPVPPEAADPSREGVLQRTSAVALPLCAQSDEDDGTLSAMHCSGRVFAFLPTEVHSRMPFLLNADFVLSSSRESIQVNRPWNAWLARTGLKEAFLRAMASLADSSGALEADILSFVPLTSSAFFAQLRTGIVDALASTRCVPVLDPASPGAPVHACPLVAPGEARVAPVALCAHLERWSCWPAVVARASTPEAATPRSSAFAIVHPEAGVRRARQLEALGVTQMAVDDWLALLGDVAWIDALPAAGLVDLLEVLRGQTWATPAVLSGLALLRVGGEHGAGPGRPRASHVRTSSAESPVFLPPSSALPMETMSLLTGAAWGTKMGSALAVASSRILLLDGDVHAEVQRRESALCEWLKTHVGARELSAAALVEHAVWSFPLPTTAPGLTDENGTRGFNDTANVPAEGKGGGNLAAAAVELAEAINVLAERGAVDSACLQRVGPLMPVALETGECTRRQALESRSPLLPRCGARWPILFAEDEARFAVLSPLYRDSPVVRVCIGAADLPAVAPPCVSTSPGEVDYPAPAVLRRCMELDAPDPSDEEASAMLDWLAFLLSDEHASAAWQEARSRRPARDDALPRGRRGPGAVSSRRPSELKRAFLTARWLRTSAGWRAPSEALVDVPELRAELGADMAWCTLPMPERVRSFLGLAADGCAAALVGHLDRMAAGPMAEPSAQPLVVKILEHLARLEGDKDVQAWAPRAQLLVCAPRPRWVSAATCAWTADRDAFLGHVPILEGEYPNSLRPLCVTKLGVRPAADDEDVMRRWLQLSAATASSRPASPRVLALLWTRLAGPVLRAARAGQVDEALWANLRAQSLVLTQAGDLVDPARACVGDAPDVLRAFRDAGVDEALNCVWTPAAEEGVAANFHGLARALGVRSLMDKAMVSVAATDTTETLPPPALLGSGVKRGVAAFLAGRCRVDFDRAASAQTLRQLCRSKESVAESIGITYTVAEGERTVQATMAARVHWDVASARLLLSRDTVDAAKAALHAPRALARVLIRDHEKWPEFEDFVGRLMLVGDDAAIEEMLDERGFAVPDVACLPAAPAERPSGPGVRPAVSEPPTEEPRMDQVVVHGVDDVAVDSTLSAGARARCAELAQAVRAIGGMAVADRAKALRQLYLRWHPDKRTDDHEAGAIFRFLKSEAERVLSEASRESEAQRDTAVWQPVDDDGGGSNNGGDGGDGAEATAPTSARSAGPPTPRGAAPTPVRMRDEDVVDSSEAGEAALVMLLRRAASLDEAVVAPVRVDEGPNPNPGTSPRPAGDEDAGLSGMAARVRVRARMRRARTLPSAMLRPGASPAAELPQAPAAAALANAEAATEVIGEALRAWVLRGLPILSEALRLHEGAPGTDGPRSVGEGAVELSALPLLERFLALACLDDVLLDSREVRQSAAPLTPLRCDTPHLPFFPCALAQAMDVACGQLRLPLAALHNLEVLGRAKLAAVAVEHVFQVRASPTRHVQRHCSLLGPSRPRAL